MAAFERVSTVNVKTLPHVTDESTVDLRTARLPSEEDRRRLMKELKQFDPRDFRQPKVTIETWRAYVDFIRVGFGAGILGMPLAISQAGSLLGPILAVMLGLLLIYTYRSLLWSINEVCRQLRIPYVSYRYAFRLSLLSGPKYLSIFGEYGPVTIATFMILSQFAICTVFVIFTSDSVRDIMDWESSTPAIMTIIIPFIALQLIMRDLKIITHIGVFAMCLNVAGLIFVVILIFYRPRRKVKLANFSLIHLTFSMGNMIFNMSAVGLVISLEKSMVKPRLMTKGGTGVIAVGMAVITVASTVFGSLGYWSFGSLGENVLRVLPYDNALTMAAMGIYGIAVALMYPLQSYPGIHMAIEVYLSYYQDPNYKPSPKQMKIIHYTTGPAFVILTCITGYLVPFQAPFIAFAGNLCTAMLAVVFPATMELCLRYPSKFGPYKVHLYKNIIILAFGLFLFTFGVYQSGLLIYIRILSAWKPSDGSGFL